MISSMTTHSFLRRHPTAARLAVVVAVAALGVIAPAAPPVGAARGDTAAIPFTEAAVSFPPGGAATVTWNAPGVKRVTVYAGTTPKVGTDREVGTGGGEDSITVTDLGSAPRWYFRLQPASGTPLVVADRSLHLTSAPNFRDVGGYRTSSGKWVRMGVAYRADSLDKLTPEENATLQALGIKVICDLRTDAERAKAPDVVVPGTTVVIDDVSGDNAEQAAATEQVIRDALAAGDAETVKNEFADIQVDLPLAEGARAAFGSVLQRLSDRANLPMVLHCTAGKDRTGWSTAALLTALGVPRDTVAADYLLSNEAAKVRYGALVDDPAYSYAVGVKPEYIEISFGAVDDEYGTFANYLRKGLDVDAATLARLRKNFLVG
jgi:protein-tyrosine phosphatase